MRRIVAIEPAGSAADDVVTLDHDRRSRRRMVFTTAAGNTILLDQPRGAGLYDGAVLRLEDGAGVRVAAADELVTDITASSLAALVRIAWHLGNRHLPTQLVDSSAGNSLRIRHDHVIEAMAQGLGGTCRTIDAPFDPEGGAYDGAPAAAHHHDHQHHHDHHHG